MDVFKTEHSIKTEYWKERSKDKKTTEPNSQLQVLFLKYINIDIFYRLQDDWVYLPFLLIPVPSTCFPLNVLSTYRVLVCCESTFAI